MKSNLQSHVRVFCTRNKEGLGTVCPIGYGWRYQKAIKQFQMYFYGFGPHAIYLASKYEIKKSHKYWIISRYARLENNAKWATRKAATAFTHCSFHAMLLSRSALRPNSGGLSLAIAIDTRQLYTLDQDLMKIVTLKWIFLRSYLSLNDFFYFSYFCHDMSQWPLQKIVSTHPPLK